MTPRLQTGRHSPFAARLATPEDVKNVWLWRNDPETRAMSGDNARIPWAKHVTWFSNALKDPNRVLLIVMSTAPAGAEHEGAVAAVRFDRQKNESGRWLVSLNLCPEWRGRGHGRSVLSAACRRFFEDHGEQPLLAAIHPANVASQRVFSAVGFEPSKSTGANALDLYERPPAPLRAT